LIDRVKEPEPKFLNVTKAQPLGNGLLLSITNAGNSSESLTDYAVEDLPKKPFRSEVVIKEGETARIVLQTYDGFKFQNGKPVQFRLWVSGGKEILFQHNIYVPKWLRKS
jgi:hypothetical protein